MPYFLFEMLKLYYNIPFTWFCVFSQGLKRTCFLDDFDDAIKISFDLSWYTKIWLNPTFSLVLLFDYVFLNLVQ